MNYLIGPTISVPGAVYAPQKAQSSSLPRCACGALGFADDPRLADQLSSNVTWSPTRMAPSHA
jgi:hypothetical protein